MELADALLENNSITNLELMTEKYTKSSAEAMAKYVRTSQRLQRIRWPKSYLFDDRESALRHREEMFCCLLPAFQKSTSLRDLEMEWPRGRGPSNLALENMLTHTQSLRSLTLISSWLARRHNCGYSPVWIRKEHYSTRVHTGISAVCND
jgi:hypothetical protein